VRNLVFRYADPTVLAATLAGNDHELPLPAGESVNDGEWVLATFLVGEAGGPPDALPRETAAAARGVLRGGGLPTVIVFEDRDWDRLVLFAEAGSMRIRVAAGVPPDTPTMPSIPASPGLPEDVTQEDPPTLRPRAASTPSYAHWRASDPFAQGPSARIMLVDDDPDIRDVVGAMLDAVGLTVDAVTSAEEALVRARGSAYDLLVLDWNLPGMTGIELCRLIRKDPGLSSLPVLFLTAHAASRDVVEAFASGADDYVVKPFRAPELGARIFGLLRRARMSPGAS